MKCIQSHARFAARARCGFTLIEVVTSLSVLTVLMLGLSSAVMISSKAIPTAKDRGLADQVVIDSIGQLRSDLREALTIKYRTVSGNTSIELSIKNSGIPGAPVTVLYNYSPTLKTLTRKVDLLSEVVLVSGIDAFAVSLTLNGLDVSVVYCSIAVKDTIKGLYEMHALLPAKPGSI